MKLNHLAVAHAIRNLAGRLRNTARTEFIFCATEEQREFAVGSRLDLADELDGIAHLHEHEAYHRNEMMTA